MIEHGHPEDKNGFIVPRRISWPAVYAGLLILVQFIGVVFWVADEHSKRQTLESRFDEFKQIQDGRNRDQGNALTRLDDLDTHAGQLTSERLLNYARRLDQLEQQMRKYDDLRFRTPRENFKVPDYPPP